MAINVMGISETRWSGVHDFYSIDGFRILSSGGAEKQRGVSVILDKGVSKSVEKVLLRVIDLFW